MGSEGCYARSFAEIYRASLVDGNAARLLRKAVAIAIVKFEIVMDAINGASNRR